jgi:preprotein translocase subunit Sss1
MGLIDKIKEMKEIYETATKPKWDDIKKLVYVTLLFFLLVAIISLPIFISLQYSIMLCQYIPLL